MTKFSLNIPTPCNEDWNSFSKTSKGRFCQSCAKEVIDFSVMTDDELIDFFQKKPQNTCGRFYPHQLKTYRPQNSPSGLKKWLPAGTLAAFLHLIQPQETTARNMPQQVEQVTKTAKKDKKTLRKNKKRESTSTQVLNITGVVKDEYGETLAGANVFIKGTSTRTTSDIDGNFKIQAREGDMLVCSYIGYEPSEIILEREGPIQFNLAQDVAALDSIIVVGYITHTKPFSIRNWFGIRVVWRKIRRGVRRIIS